MKLSNRFLIFLAGLLPLGACARAPMAVAVSAEVLAQGATLYEQSCAICHYDGKGSSINPPLIGARSITQSDPTALLRIILHGVGGQTDSDGKFVKAIMPAQDSFSDEEIAAVSAYVRVTFGKQNETIPLDLVAKVRAEKPVEN